MKKVREWCNEIIKEHPLGGSFIFGKRVILFDVNPLTKLTLLSYPMGERLLDFECECNQTGKSEFTFDISEEVFRDLTSLRNVEIPSPSCCCAVLKKEV